jgi:inosose dehydratase
MRIGTAPITWGVCEMEGWGERLPVERVLDDMAALGYAGTELGPAGYLPAQPERLRALVDPRGLAMMAAFCPVSLHDPDAAAPSLAEARHTARVLRDAGGEYLVLADAGTQARLTLAGRVPADGSAGFTPEQWARFADGVQQLAAEAIDMGLRSVFHPEAGSFVETPDEIERLLALTNADLVGLCLETGHMTYGGGDAAAMARRFAGRIRHVHAKDVDPALLDRVSQEGLGYFDATAAGIFAPIGQGCVDFASVLDALVAADYDGWLIVEQDVRLGAAFAPQDVRRNAELSKRALDALLARA